MDIIEGHCFACYTLNHSSLSQKCLIIHPSNKKMEVPSYLPCLFFFPTLHRQFSRSYSFSAVSFLSNYSLFTFMIMALIWALHSSYPDSPRYEFAFLNPLLVTQLATFLIGFPNSVPSCFTIPVFTHAPVMMPLILCSYMPEKSFSFICLVDSN